MTPQVFPISMTNFDWPNFFKLAYEGDPRSLTDQLDQVKISYTSPLGTLSVLDQFHSEGPWIRLSSSLDHFSFGFIAVASREDLLIVAQRLQLPYLLAASGKAIIITASVLDWQTRLIFAHTVDRLPTSDGSLRILNLFVLMLEQAGLHDLFSGYRKIGDFLFLFESKHGNS